MRLWIKSSASLVLVTCTGYFLDRLLRHEGVPGQDILLLSDLLVGLVAAALVYLMAMFDDRRQRAVEARLKVIAEMNHHVRNALQVIVYHAGSLDENEIAAIKQSVDRISWALREVLPQLPGHGDDGKG